MKKTFYILGILLLFTSCRTNYNKKEVMTNMIKVVINNSEYNLILENNETANKFLELLPKEFNMTELNGNEKYVYLDKSLPSDSVNPKEIVAGDVMLYGDDCLVIFYKTFKTSYAYTKIGHIDNMPNLNNDNILVKFKVT